MTQQSMNADVVRSGQARWRNWVRAGVLFIFAVFVLGSLFGMLQQVRTERISNGGVDVEVNYPHITRSGEEIQVRLDINSAEPLPAKLTLSLDQEYASLFEDLALAPEGAQRAESQGRLGFTVDTAQAKSAQLTFSGVASGTWTPKKSGTLSLQIGRDVDVELQLHTWRAP